MSDASKLKRQWCVMLAKLVAPMDAQAAAAAFIDILPMLAPDDSFYNRTTLENAARRAPGDTAIPNYDRLARVFSDWRKDQLPVHIRMGGGQSAGQLTYEKEVLTPEQEAEHDRKVAALKAEMAAATPSKPESGIEPRYATKVQLAAMWLQIDPDTAKLRPDLREAWLGHLAAHNSPARVFPVSP